VKAYSLISFADDKTHALVDLKVLTDDARELKVKVPGVYLTREATVEAPDPETAYVQLICAMITAPQDSPAAGFWQRVAHVPRIRFVALRRFGLRAVGTLLQDYHPYGVSTG